MSRLGLNTIGSDTNRYLGVLPCRCILGKFVVTKVLGNLPDISDNNCSLFRNTITLIDGIARHGAQHL